MDGIIQERLNGGIAQILLMPVAGTIVSRRNNELYCEPSSDSVACEPIEDSAEWLEQRVMADGVERVKHSLTFRVRGDSPTIPFVEQNKDGTLAIIEFRNGVTLLAGFSWLFLVEQPLRVEQRRLTSGATRTDDAEYLIRLSSEDNAFACSLTLS